MLMCLLFAGNNETQEGAHLCSPAVWLEPVMTQEGCLFWSRVDIGFDCLVLRLLTQVVNVVIVLGSCLGFAYLEYWLKT